MSTLRTLHEGAPKPFRIASVVFDRVDPKALEGRSIEEEPEEALPSRI